jgi:hypothetical protein
MSAPIRKALYYPHTTVDSEEILKTALLTWDHLEYIVPWEGFSPDYRSKNAARAMEMIGKEKCPTAEEKEETHGRIKQLVEGDVPDIFYFTDDYASRDQIAYEVYPQKFHKKTWKLLRDKKIRGDLLRNRDYPVSEPAGLTIMSILADCCAGQTTSRVTDRGDAYAALASTGTTLAAPDALDIHDHLISINLEVLDFSQLSFTEVIESREREEKENGLTLRDLRHRYLDSLQTFVDRIRSETSSKSDAEEVVRQFKDDMRVDLDSLKKELRFADREALLSKEMLVTTVAAAGAVGSWLFGLPVALSGVITAAGGPATVGGFAAVRNKFLSSRHSVMQRHPMAYLYHQSLRNHWQRGSPWIRLR